MDRKAREERSKERRTRKGTEHVPSDRITIVLVLLPSAGSATYVGRPPMVSSRPWGVPEATRPLRQQEDMPISVDMFP